MKKQNQLIEAMNDHSTLTPAQREMLAGYVEGMIGIRNAYCMSSEDLQILAGYVLDKSNR